MVQENETEVIGECESCGEPVTGDDGWHTYNKESGNVWHSECKEPQ